MIKKSHKKEKLAFLLGMFAGDGCLPIKHNGEGYRNYQIAFYNTDKKHVTLFSNLFLELFRIKGRILCRQRKNKKKLWSFEKYSKEAAIRFNQDFEIPFGKKAVSVFIPSFIKTAENNIKKSFLFGLLITDGCIRKNKSILFHIASKRLIEDIAEVISVVWGVQKNIRSYKQGKFNSYQISLNTTESKQILKDMPPWHNLVLRGF